jgi:hypothetical protein
MLFIAPTRVMLKPQRDRQMLKLYSLIGWAVELVQDEEWGRVLVAQRDFAPGEVIIQSGAVVAGRTPAELVRCWLHYFEAGGQELFNYIATDIKFATSSPR